MALQPRIDKTIERMRRGALPASTRNLRLLARGDGRPCDGCGETIRPTENRIGVAGHDEHQRRFHEECYEAWAALKH